MNFIQLLILQFIAHILTDFTFQSDSKAKEKNSAGFRSKYLKWHILISFGVSWILSFQFYFIFASLAIALSHWLIDGFKSFFNKKILIGKYMFFIDQFLHLIFIFLISYFFYKLFMINALFNIPLSAKYLAIIGTYLICTKPANIFIRELFNLYDIRLDVKSKGIEDLPNAGKLIGIIERWLVFTFIMLKQYEAVGFLIAAKSILRYKDTETLKTEYVLIGTMLSFGIAIALGLVIKQF
jgi:hypothetical protein